MTVTYTPAPPLDYQRFVDIALRHRDWAVSYRADATHTTTVFEAQHDSGLTVLTSSLDALSLLLRVSSERLLDLEELPDRVRPYLIAGEEQQDQEVEERRLLAELTSEFLVQEGAAA